MKERVNIYVDGFNFYFGIKSKGWRKYYWLDIVGFFSLFIKPGQELRNVLYFTATPKDRGKKDRQDLFFSANKVDNKFKLIFGKYIEKKVRFGGKEYRTYEEKQTDVNIAVELIRNVIQNKCEVSVIVSADSDLLPPIRLIRELYPTHKIICFFPPKRYSRDLSNHADAIINLERYESRFKRSILPDHVKLANGYVVKRPKKWM
jgi:uncharacterized LabA/DUF88 family protein